MENRIKDLEENQKLQTELLQKLQAHVKKVKKENESLAEELHEKEKVMHELKMKRSDCNCSKYSKSIDEIYNAGSKHKQKLVELKDIAIKQKMKIAQSQEEKTAMLDQVEHLKYDLTAANYEVKNLKKKRMI